MLVGPCTSCLLKWPSTCQLCTYKLCFWPVHISNSTLNFISMVLIVTLEELFVVSMLMFTLLSTSYDTYWFSFGIMFWLGIVFLLIVPVLSSANKRSTKAYMLYTSVITWLIFTGVSLSNFRPFIRSTSFCTKTTNWICSYSYF